MERRTLALLLGVVMAFGLTACGGSETAITDDVEEVVEQTEREENEPAGLHSAGDVGE